MKGNGGSKKAIVIGVSDYDMLQPLSFCKNDGDEMYKVLKSLNYEILPTSKLIGRVQREEMRQAIIDFFLNKNVRPKDTLLFYYSGHGILDGYGDHYFATSALDPFQPDTHGFLFDELTRMVDKSNSQKIVIILDCCYSGAARIGKGGDEDAADAGRAAINEKSRLLERGEGRCILAASQAYQKAFETKEKNHSLFTYYLLQALSGKEELAVDKDGYLTVETLSRYLYNTILDLPPEKRPAQTPIRKVVASGDIVLAHFSQLVTKLKTVSPVSSLDTEDVITKGNIHLDKKEYQKALEYYQKIITDPNLAKAWINKGIALHQLQEYEESLKAVDLGIELDPNNAVAWTNKGMFLMNLFRYNEAVLCFQKSIELSPKDFDFWDILGICLIRLERYDEAMKAFDKAAKFDDSSAVVWYGKGEILQIKKRYDEALICFDNALKLDSFFPLPWYRKGEILVLNNRYDEALICFDKAIENADTGDLRIGPTQIKSVWKMKAVLWAHLQKYDEALVCVNRLLEFDPNDAEYWNMKGVALVSLGRYSEALQCFERSLELDPTEETVVNNRTYALNKLRESSGQIGLGNRHYDNKKN